MTFNPVAAINVLESRNKIIEKTPSAIDLGSQTASIDNIFIKNLVRQNKFLNNSQIQSLNDLVNKDHFNTKDFFFICWL